MLRLLIVADDLSGAADSAIACTRTGLCATVSLGDGAVEPSAEVLAVDCDTRGLSAHEAAERVGRLVSRYVTVPDLLLFKKIDSTLRGNIGAELAAMLAVRRAASTTGRRVVIVMAPAFPAGGRTTVDGCQFVHGVALHETETWASYADKSAAHLPTSLTKTGLEVATLGLDQVRAGNDALIRAMQDASADADVLICDAETDADLRAIAEASMVLGSETIWAGSAGLAYHLPHAAGLAGGLDALADVSVTSCAGPALVLVGTMSSVTREQAKTLSAQEDVELLALAASVLLAGPGSEAWAGYSLRLTEALRGGRDSIVMLEADAQHEQSDGAALAKALGVMISPHADKVGALIASGGETARSILALWGVTQLRLIGELEPGLPVSVTAGWSRSMLVITKAGAFGTPQTLVRCLEFVRSRSLERAGILRGITR